MGMFDDVVCRMPLLASVIHLDAHRNFQSKDLACEMAQVENITVSWAPSCDSHRMSMD